MLLFRTGHMKVTSKAGNTADRQTDRQVIENETAIQLL